MATVALFCIQHFFKQNEVTDFEKLNARGKKKNLIGEHGAACRETDGWTAVNSYLLLVTAPY